MPRHDHQQLLDTEYVEDPGPSTNGHHLDFEPITQTSEISIEDAMSSGTNISSAPKMLNQRGENNSRKEIAQNVFASDRPTNIGTDGTLEPEDDALEYMVEIPEVDDNKFFSFRKLWAFTGPGFLMSIAYLDPGNIESDLQSGAIARYKLLWVLLSAHIVGFFLQRLAVRLGVVSGRHMAEVAYEFYPLVPRCILWLMTEIAIIGSDMQEVIGTAIAFYLLSNGNIPLFAGVLITMADTFTFLLIDRFGFRKLEVLFAALIGMMALSFGYEFVVVKPDGIDMMKGMFIPWCENCGREEFLQGVSIVGAVIMPHNLYLHSALVKSRRIDRTRKTAITEANFYYFVESGIALFCSFIINLFVVAVFAHGLYGKTNADVHKSCQNREGIPPLIFPNNTEKAESDLYKGGIFLGCEFGLMAMYVWGVGIMAAGQSSTMTGTYAGQFVMEGFLRIQWPRWRRVLFTRAMAIIPTLGVALMARGVENLTGMNDLLNCVQMIQLPFALIPIITFTSHPKIMFEYACSRTFQISALCISMAVISINLYFSTDYILNSLGTEWYVWILLIIPCIFYVTFVLYLIFICLQSMGIIKTGAYNKVNWLSRRDSHLTIQAPWLNSQQQCLTSDTIIRPVSGTDSGVDNLGFAATSSNVVNRTAAVYGSSYIE
ncbi:natural resistance-associated macrophage protein [Ditylenchus destructor]|nr:natural resistance-associated macrophage protein [Ditylenchus destructor]